MESTVLSFIDSFKDSKEMFLTGKCYWFAKILELRFKGKLFYNPVLNHWATLIEDSLYDASGSISAEGFDEWPGKFKDDELEYERLLKNCILYTEGMKLSTQMILAGCPIRESLLLENETSLSRENITEILNLIRRGWTTFKKNLEHVKGIAEVKRLDAIKGKDVGYSFLVNYISGDSDQFNLTVSTLTVNGEFPLKVEYVRGISKPEKQNIASSSLDTMQGIINELFGLAEEYVLSISSIALNKKSGIPRGLIEDLADYLESYGNPLSDFLYSLEISYFDIDFSVTYDSIVLGEIDVAISDDVKLNYKFTSELITEKPEFKLSVKAEVISNTVSSYQKKYSFKLTTETLDAVASSISEEIISLLKKDLKKVGYNG